MFIYIYICIYIYIYYMINCFINSYDLSLKDWLVSLRKASDLTEIVYSLAGQARSHVQQNTVHRCDELKGRNAEQLQKGSKLI